MAWLEVHQTLRDHRKTLAAADELEVEPVHMLGMMVSFWLWALDNAPDGTLAGITPRTIARAAQWKGDADHFVEALISAGWLEETESVLEIHDWYEYAGKLIDRRKADAERARLKRAAASPLLSVGTTSAGHPSDIGRTSDENPQYVPKTSAGTPPHSTLHQSKELISLSTESDGEAEALKLPIQERRFNEFWAAYPKKVAKKTAEASWKKLKPDADLHGRIMTAVGRARATEQWTKENGRYIPNPATWLNQGRWDDEYAENRVSENTSRMKLEGFHMADDEEATRPPTEEPKLTGFKRAWDDDEDDATDDETASP